MMNMDPKDHLWLPGTRREDRAVLRWLFGHCDEAMRMLGLPEGWWCGLALPRHQVFGDGKSGDVDLVAGPLRVTADVDEWSRRIEQAAQRYAGWPKGLIEDVVRRDLCRDGFLEWPPAIEYIAAIEAKASYFDDERWKNTHVRDRTRLCGQLKYLQNVGVNRVGVLQLGVTKPAGTVPNDWTAIEKVMDRAGPAWPLIFDPDWVPGVAYWRGFMGAATNDTEAVAGVHHGLEEFVPPTDARRGEKQAWHDSLHARFAAMVPPPYFRTVVMSCAQCGLWRHINLGLPSSPPCLCQAAEA